MLNIFKKIKTPAKPKTPTPKIKIDPKPIEKPVAPAETEYMIHSDIPIKASEDRNGQDIYKAKAGDKLYLIGDNIYYLTFESDPEDLFAKHEVAQFDAIGFTMPACEIYIRLISAE